MWAFASPDFVMLKFWSFQKVSPSKCSFNFVNISTAKENKIIIPSKFF